MAEATSEPEIDLLPDAIADAFWLVAHGFFAPSAERLRIGTTPPPTQPTPPPPVLPPPTPLTTQPPPPPSPPVPAPISVPETAPEAGQITLPTGHEQMKPGGEEPAGLPLRVPAGRALPGALELARALRPLMRRVPARTQLVLDEDETVRRVAEEGLWLPAMNPAPTRWLEVAVVVDANPSMRVWRETTRELRLLIERVGAFRDVRLWSLKSTPAKPGTPATMTLHAPGRKAVRAPAELLDPAGRRIILIVTDTMGEVWRDGTARRFMDGWCRRSCVALLHLLPQPLWRRTALKPARQIRVTTAEAGAPNLRLRALPLRPQALLWEAPDGVPIPVLPLEPAFVNAWAQLLAGSSRVRPLAVVFAPDDTPSETHRQGKTLSAMERVESFRNSNAGSPLVLQLASLFAAAPLRLPIMRLVQQALLPQSRQVHFAEVFLGGLMRRVSSAQEDEDPDEVAYEFFDGVRDLLRNSSPIGDSIEVVKTVSRYIEGRFGSAFDFEAMLADPDAAQPMASGGVPEIFATISAEVLRGLGGAHARAADRLLKRAIPTPLPSPLGNARRALLSVLVQRVAIPLSNPLLDARRSLLDVLVQRSASRLYAEVLPAEVPSSDRPFQGISILWVDDYPSNNIYEADQLTSEGATVTEARSTVEALELLGRGFDAIISDLGRGDEKFAGFDLLKEVRGRGLTMPFAIYAGRKALQYRAKALELGATVSSATFSEVRASLLQSFARAKTSGDEPPADEIQERWVRELSEFPLSAQIAVLTRCAYRVLSLLAGTSVFEAAQTCLQFAEGRARRRAKAQFPGIAQHFDRALYALESTGREEAGGPLSEAQSRAMAAAALAGRFAHRGTGEDLTKGIRDLVECVGASVAEGKWPENLRQAFVAAFDFDLAVLRSSRLDLPAICPVESFGQLWKVSSIEQIPKSTTVPGRWIVAVGAGDLSESSTALCKDLGAALAAGGFGLIHTGWPGAESATVEAFAARVAMTDARLDDWVLQILEEGRTGSAAWGRIVPAANTRESMKMRVERADAMIVISGGSGTAGLAETAVRHHLPVLPFEQTGGVAAEVHDRLFRVDEYSWPSWISHEQAAGLGGDFPETAVDTAIEVLKHLPARVRPSTPETRAKMSIFISYSYKDEAWKHQVVLHLQALGEEIEVWNDRQIGAGQEWQAEISSAIERAGVAVLLVTANFLVSKFIQQEEVPRLLAAHRAGQLAIVPFIIMPCAWKRLAWLASLQVRPKDGRAVRLRHDGTPASESEMANDLTLLADEIAALLDSRSVSSLSEAAPNSIAETPSPVTAAAEATSAGDLTANFQNSFKEAAEIIERITVYLELHDELHRFERQTFTGILNDYRRIPDDESAREGLSLSASAILETVHQTRALAERLTKLPAEISWIDTLDRAHGLLIHAIEKRDPAPAITAVTLLNRVLDMEPIRISAEIAALTNVLDFSPVRSMLDVLRSRLGADAPSANAEEVRVGIEAVSRLEDNFRVIVKAHSAWQRIEQDMRTIEFSTTTSFEHLEYLWPVLRDLATPLFAGSTEPWGIDLANACRDLEKAISAQDSMSQREVRLRFLKFRRLCGDHFFMICEELRQACLHLSRVGDSLDLLERQLDVPRPRTMRPA